MGQGWRGLGGGCGAWGKGRTGGGEPQGELGFLSTQDKGAGRRDFKGLAVGVRGCYGLPECGVASGYSSPQGVVGWQPPYSLLDFDGFEENSDGTYGCSRSVPVLFRSCAAEIAAASMNESEIHASRG